VILGDGTIQSFRWIVRRLTTKCGGSATASGLRREADTPASDQEVCHFGTRNMSHLQISRPAPLTVTTPPQVALLVWLSSLRGEAFAPLFSMRYNTIDI